MKTKVSEETNSVLKSNKQTPRTRFMQGLLEGTCSRVLKFFFLYNFFLTQTLYISSVKPFLNRTTIFKLIVHGIELHEAFEEERENKQKNAKF